MAQPQPAAYAVGRDDRKPFQHSHVASEHAALIQSRETGDVIPDDSPTGKVKALPFAKSWVHMMAGGFVLAQIPSILGYLLTDASGTELVE